MAGRQLRGETYAAGVTAGSERQEYEGRVNAVMDYVEAHLGEELSVEQLAGVAHFSPYHFHRVFSSMTGETLGAFVARLRIEHAASRLAAQPRRAITDIALESGFTSPSSFSRAFRETYGMTPSDWRAGGHRQHVRQSRAPEADARSEALARAGSYRVTGSRLAPETGRTVWDVTAGPLGTVAVEIEQLPRIEVAYVRTTGRYQGLGAVFARLYSRIVSWAEPRGFVGPGATFYNLYHDDPGLTDDDRLRLTVCVPVPAETLPEGDIGRTAIEPGACAVGRFELGEQDYPAAWHAMAGGWLPDSGYEPDDRLPWERFVVGRDAGRPDAQVVDIGLPVRPRRIAKVRTRAGGRQPSRRWPSPRTTAASGSTTSGP